MRDTLDTKYLRGIYYLIYAEITHGTLDLLLIYAW